MFTSYDPTGMTEALVGGGVGLAAIIGVIVFFVLKYRVKIEQIKADAMIRAEEIRAKNQLEIERMLMEDRQKQTGKNQSDYNQSNYKANNNPINDDLSNDDEIMQNRRNQKNRI